MEGENKMKTKTTKHFYRWRYAAPFRLSYLIPHFSFTKNVQGPTFNRSYSVNWINWAFTIWHTVYDYQEDNCYFNVIAQRYNIHELNVEKYLR